MSFKSPLSWSAQKVADWLVSNGFGSHVHNFIENDITGDILIHADHDLLRELSIESVGTRIAILKAIYNEKVANGIPIEDDDYVPETAMVKTGNLAEKSTKVIEGWALNRRRSRVGNDDASKLEAMIIDRDSIIQKLTAEVARLSTELAVLKDDLTPVWSLVKEYKTFQVKSEMRKKSADKSSYNANSYKNISRNNIISPVQGKNASPKVNSNELLSIKTSPSDHSMGPYSSQVTSPIDDGTGAIKVFVDKNLKKDAEPYKTFKVSVYDPCSRILPVALKKYKIDDDWHNYALFVHFKGQERCLNFDERPLEISLKLKDATESPIFVLKHLKQVDKVERDSLELDPSQAAQEQLKNAVFKKKVAYAVAVYEYKAEREDEIDVAIGDTFKVVKTESGWCVVEKDGKQYWVPASCLVENEEKESHEPSATPKTSASASTGMIGRAIYDYKKISPNEMSIRTGDTLKIHKKFNHWLLAECGDQKGWVPSCYVSINGDNGGLVNP